MIGTNSINPEIINNITRVTKEEDNLGNNDRLLNSLKTSRNYMEFKNYTKESFKLLDSINQDNIYRVYTNFLFLNTLIKNFNLGKKTAARF